MPFVVTCPKCSTRLKTPNPVPAGRAVTCPQCKHAFTTTEESPELADTASAPALARPPVPPPPPKKARQEELAAAEIVDDDEDDRPRAKRRRDEDDEDDRPRAKKKRDDDEDDEDDRPRAKKRRDDGADDRPRAKKAKKPLILILAVALPVLLLVAAVGGVLAYRHFGGRGGDGASTEMLVWAPSNSTSVKGVNYAKISQHPSFRQIVQADLSRLDNLSVPLIDVEEALIANGPSNQVIVVRTKVKLDPEILRRAASGREVAVGPKKYYWSLGGCFHLPSSKMLVYTFTEKAMIDLLTKEEKVTVGNGLRECAGKAAGDLWWAHASEFGSVMSFGGAGMSQVYAPKGMYGGRQIVGDKMKYSQSLVFADAAAAQQAEGDIRRMDQTYYQAPGFRREWESFAVSSAGATVTISVVGPIGMTNGSWNYGGY